MQAEEQKKLQEKIKLEERKLLLAQRNLHSIRLIAELLSRAKVTFYKPNEFEQAFIYKPLLKTMCINCQ